MKSYRLIAESSCFFKSFKPENIFTFKNVTIAAVFLLENMGMKGAPGFSRISFLQTQLKTFLQRLIKSPLPVTELSYGL